MRIAVFALLAVAGLAAQQQDRVPIDLETLGAQAFRSGYALTAMAAWRDQYLKAGGSINQFRHSREILSAFANVSFPNTDTLQSSAWVELSSGPVTLSVPATGSRYITIQFVSAWAETFAILSRKQLEGRATTLYLTPPGWSGTVPQGYRRIPCPTSMLFVMLRLFVAAEGDVSTVTTLQRQFAFSEAAAPRPVPASTLEALGALLPANPPPPSMRSLFERLAPLGLNLEKGFDPFVLDAESRRDVDAAIALSRKDLPGMQRKARRVEGGWIVWDAGPAIPGSQEERISRAHAGPDAFAALPDREVVYALCYADSNGQRLWGDRRYAITLDPGALPPVDGFWSITVYNASGRTVFGARQSIHSSMPYLHKTLGGAIRITLGPSLPLAEQYNWLPLQSGEEARVELRLYQPRQAVLDGSWRLPAIVPTAQAGP